MSHNNVAVKKGASSDAVSLRILRGYNIRPGKKIVQLHLTGEGVVRRTIVLEVKSEMEFDAWKGGWVISVRPKWLIFRRRVRANKMMLSPSRDNRPNWYAVDYGEAKGKGIVK